MNVQSAFAAQGYAQARPATTPQPTESLMGTLGNSFADFTATFAQAEHVAQATMTSEADPQALVEALAQTQLAVETVVALRDRVVEAYQEILRMPL